MCIDVLLYDDDLLPQLPAMYDSAIPKMYPIPQQLKQPHPKEILFASDASELALQQVARRMFCGMQIASIAMLLVEARK